MVFSGITFLYYFLPCVLLVYFLTPIVMHKRSRTVEPQRVQNVVLLLASLFFYAWGEPVYVLLMLLSILVGYIAGILLERTMEKPRKFLTPKAVLAVAVGFFTVLFVYFKYTDFFITNINAAVGLSIPLRHIVLPIGISFYTFQMISYLVDVYRKEVPAQKNFVSLALYISMFPQLIAGPIVRYSTVAEQIDSRKSTWEGVEGGISRFIAGLSKKVLLANELGRLCDIFRDSAEPSVIYYWLYAIAFSLHIYFDFSGYSDMAIGLGKIFGFTFPENFNYPYISTSITEFWRRWHMSLGTWFRDYLYIPLGGNRVSKAKWYRNILLVWLFTGFWHGASWNFVVWGLYFGVLLVMEKNLLLPFLKKAKVLNHIYVLLLLVISFVIFNGENLVQAAGDIQNMFGLGGLPLFSKETGYYLRSFAVTIVLAMVGSTPLINRIGQKIQKEVPTVTAVAKPVILAVLAVLSTAYLVDGSFNPFLYFRF